MAWVKNRVLLVLVGTGAAAAAGLAFLTQAPNRLVLGTGISLAATIASSAGSTRAWALVTIALPALLLAAAVFVRPGRATHLWVVACATVLLAGWVSLAGIHAAQLASTANELAPGANPDIARTSFGGAFWIVAVLSWLTASDAIARLGLKPVSRLLANVAVVAPVLVCLAIGRLDQLSLLKEYAHRADAFGLALRQHIEIVAASVVPSLVIGIPLGIASTRASRWMNALRTPLFASLNVVQTIPSIALFALLLAPLALLAEHVPMLGRLGIKGVGLAPAVIALTLYALLPIVRNTYTGITGVDPAVQEAGRGMGMTDGQLLRLVELPLGLGVILAGVRVATVVGVGTATIAAAIGAGGLGVYIFRGVATVDNTLILAGALPAAVMALGADGLLGLAERKLAWRGK